ncbi:MAG TPA: hybrid sensor histidine kinase/response regulator [Segetibacter sp.]
MDTSSTKEFTILLVDDRPENNILLEETLQKENRKFLVATSGNEALRLCLKNKDIGLIMLDVQMPEMDGFEVARFLKSNNKTKDIAIIFVTAINKEEQYVLQGFEEGAVDYLQKPLDINVTRAKVNVFEKLYLYQSQLKYAVDQLEVVNKQLERFVYMVSHDLKSPLASIVTILSTLHTDELIKSNADVTDKIDMVTIASIHLSEMINSILEYSKLSFEQQTIEEVNTYELVSQIVFLLFPPKNIKIVISESLPTINTRKLKLQQVFQNLVSNAIKYNDKPQGLIEIDVREEEKFYRFSVKDNGPGINKDAQNRVFKLFETAGDSSNNDSSTGIGLNILKIIVEEQGGKVWVDCQTGAGSIFYFTWRKEDIR